MAYAAIPEDPRIPGLTPEQIELRAKNRRVTAVLNALRHASDGVALMDWLSLSEEAVQRRYAESVEPLLKAAEERGWRCALCRSTAPTTD